MKKILIAFIAIIILLSGCSPAVHNNAQTVQQATVFQPTDSSANTNGPATPLTTTEAALPTETAEIKSASQNITQTVPSITTETPAVAITDTPKPTLAPEAWKDLPVIPVVSPGVLKIYQHGLELGNNPNAFSKIGDCGSTPAWFLGDFDRGPRFYSLGDYQNLETVIQAFQGSYSRTSLAAKAGFNASSILATLWSDPKQCQPGETPLACEYRVNRPILAFIMLGSNDVFHPKEFEPQMRKIIEYSIQQGVIPVLTTKADNEEGDGSINSTIARLANEYDIPLWNYWRAVQDLPDKGLQEDQVHLTWGPNHFDDSQTMTRAWPVRNLTALQTLDAIWKVINSQK